MGGRNAVGTAVLVWAGLATSGWVRPPAAGLLAGSAAALALAQLLGRRSRNERLRSHLPGAAGASPSDHASRSKTLRRAAARVALAAALFLAGFARGAAHREVLIRQRAALGAELHRIEARVVEPPLRESGMPSATVCVLRSAPPLARGSRVRVWMPPGSTAEWGDRIAALVLIDPPSGPRNPGGIDARVSADAAALAGWGRALTVTVLDSTGVSGWPRATAARWRRAIEHGFATRLTSAAREIVTPLVVGDRTGLSSELDAAFRAAGVVHLLALSGLHVTWMAGVARVLVAGLGFGVRARAGAGAACAIFYMALAGPLPSLVRAVATEVFVAGAKLGRRPLDPVQALALSALAGLVVAPGWAADLGFQLSCAATLGLVTVGAGLAERAGRARRAVDLVLPTASAQLTALPLLLARLHAVSWIAPATNLLAVPVSGLLLAAAWLAALWEAALPGTARAAFSACEVLVMALREVTEFGARAPHAAFSTGMDSAPAVVAALGAALVAYALVPRRALFARRSPADPRHLAGGLVGGACVIGAFLAAITARPLAPRVGAAWIVTLDVGQGDAIALGTPSEWWLIDAGPKSPRGDAGERFVLPFTRWAGVRSLAGLVLTHDDADHTGGARAVRRGLPVRRCFAPPPRPDATGPGPRFGAHVVARGDTLTGDPCVRVLWPPRSMPAGWSDNRAGIAIEVACDTQRVLLLADIDTTAEVALDVRPAAALKVAHHGSHTSTSPVLLERTRPRLAIVSCGRRNRYGHPHPEIIARLREAGAEVRRTDDEGAIWLELDAEGARIVDWREHARVLRRDPTAQKPRAPGVRD